jgi:diguanylate cyclase (GGDEF)-like protein/PAS domain S-box-containing protein
MFSWSTEVASVSEEPSTALPRILYVNTTGHAQHGTARILVDAGFCVQEISNADEVLHQVEREQLHRSQPLPDLVLLEAAPLDVKCLEVCEKIKTNPHTAYLPLVYLSDLAAAPSQRITALKRGADSYLTQPLDPAELVAMVQALLRLKASEAELHRSNAYLVRLFDGASGPILVWDDQRNITRLNQAVESLTGRAAAQMAGRPVGELFATAQSAQAFLSAAEGQSEPHRVPFEFDIAHLDGAVRTVLWTASTLIAINGKTPVATVAQGLDVTERKADEAKLRIAATAFDCQEGLSVTDARGLILQVNRAFCQTTGYSADEVIGKNPRVLGAGRHDADFFKDMWDVIARTGTWQGEIWNQRKNGEQYIEWLTIAAVKNAAGEVINYVGTHSDISQRKAAEQEIQTLAFYDPLTGLPNRRLLRDRLERSLATSTRSGREGSVLFIDLDGFKYLNDTFGHGWGDLLLKQVAQRLGQCVREGDTVARLGGDEFVVVLEELGHQSLEAAARTEEIGHKMLDRMREVYRIDGHEYQGTASIGATLFSDHRESIEQLLKQADLAMYRAKASGRNAMRFFDPSMQAAVEARSTLERELRLGLQANQFLLYYQGQVDLEDRLIGVEALLRWQHPTRGLVLPNTFIPLAEETGLIRPLGRWVLQTACEQLAVWSRQPKMMQVTMAVNVSAREFEQADFVQQVLMVLERTGADPKRLKFELTESTLMRDIDAVIAKMHALKKHGMCFALDDFGTGFSSLSSLRRLPLDRLKIDQSFVAGVLTDPSEAAIAKTIVAMAGSLNMGVIAEGVETQGQRDFLASSGCQSFQGYLFGQPEPVELLC